VDDAGITWRSDFARSGSIYSTVSQNRRPPVYLLNNSVKNQPTLIIFGTLNSEKN